MKVEFLPFTNEMIPDAGKLIAIQYKPNRTILPLLPSRFEDEKVTTEALQTLWQKIHHDGFAAFRDGKLVACLLGDFSVQNWGRCGYVYLPGYGLEEAESPELIQDLYALLGDEWVKKGCFNHYIYLMDSDIRIVNAMFDVGFGKERVDALLDLKTLEIPKVKLAGDFEIRLAGKGDNDLLASLSTSIARHQSRAPRWHPLLPEDFIELEQGWAELAEDSTVQVWLALDGREVLGTCGFFPKEETIDDFTVPAKCRYMTVAATKESARGRGIGVALTWHGLEQARANGNEFALTN